MASPYEGISQQDWKEKTMELIGNHPLQVDTIRDVALRSWDTLWRTTLGEGATSINLYDLDVPATVVGYFFEKLFAKCLQELEPTLWRGGQGKEEKDIVYIPNSNFSVEMKCSGQLGNKVFGNRSYGQESDIDSELNKKEKSGYYITVNFYEKSLNLLRFGWIDHSDWKAQASETGQASNLKSEVYKYKLLEIPGEYRLKAPVSLLPGVGPKRKATFAEEGIKTIRELKEYKGNNKLIITFRNNIVDF